MGFSPQFMHRKRSANIEKGAILADERHEATLGFIPAKLGKVTRYPHLKEKNLDHSLLWNTMETSRPKNLRVQPGPGRNRGRRRKSHSRTCCFVPMPWHYSPLVVFLSWSRGAALSCCTCCPHLFSMQFYGAPTPIL